VRFWGGGVALGVRLLIDWQQPETILRWILGYGMGGYVAIPHYGLLSNEARSQIQDRDRLMTEYPLVAFILISASLAHLSAVLTPT
jgi:hypothetical protein